MSSDKLLYPPDVLDFLANRIPAEMMGVFVTIAREAKHGGISWKDLVDKSTENRLLVEKALVLLDATGFITVTTSSVDRRMKTYMPDPDRGLQLVQYIKAKREVKSTERTE